MRVGDKKSGDKMIRILKNLIRSCERGQTGFTRAAGGVSDPGLETLLTNYARELGMFAQELDSMIRKVSAHPNGELFEPDDRSGLHLNEVIENKDIGGIISEICRVEETAVVEYENAFKMDLPAPILSALERQYSRIRQTIHSLRSLERN